MAYPYTRWKDHAVERPRTYTEVVNPDGSKTFTDAPGEILQQGTPMSSTNFNNLEVGVGDAHTFVAIFSQAWLQFRRWLDSKFASEAARTTLLEADDAPEIKTVSMTNTAKWPFNNSVQTVALTTNRPTTNYTVDAEVKAVTGGTVQAVRITDRLANGFKVSFEGDATAATLKLIIKGGITR